MHLCTYERGECTDIKLIATSLAKSWLYLQLITKRNLLRGFISFDRSGLKHGSHLGGVGEPRSLGLVEVSLLQWDRVVGHVSWRAQIWVLHTHVLSLEVRRVARALHVGSKPSIERALVPGEKTMSVSLSVSLLARFISQSIIKRMARLLESFHPESS